MLALIMAGGQGSRLRMGEKPLVTICGRPMLSYVIDAFESAGHEVIVVASHRTPYTRNWCRARGLLFMRRKGSGTSRIFGKPLRVSWMRGYPSSHRYLISPASHPVSSLTSKTSGARRGCRHAPRGCPVTSARNMAAARSMRR